ncbi:MAG: cytochrome c [Syntrophotaleaceae bacterium]
MKFLALLLTVGLTVAALPVAGLTAEGTPEAGNTAQAGDSGMTPETRAKLVQLGDALAQRDRCVVCHRDRGMAQPLAGIAEGKTDEYLRQSIVDPKEVLGPTTRMPAYDYTLEEAQAMVEYLRSLSKP